MISDLHYFVIGLLFKLDPDHVYHRTDLIVYLKKNNVHFDQHPIDFIEEFVGYGCLEHTSVNVYRINDHLCLKMVLCHAKELAQKDGDVERAIDLGDAELLSRKISHRDRDQS